MKILIVEDEKELLQSVSTYLRKEGYVCEEASNYAEAEDKIFAYDYEVAIIDITLPGGSGLSLLELLKKEQKNTGILIVSARDSLDDKLKGLDLGADDYITKPFHMAELNSRINAVVRRRFYKGKEIITFNEIVVDTLAKEVEVNGRPVDLTKKEFELLLYLIINKNRVLTKVSIAEHIGGDHFDMADNFDFIYTHIKNLRKKIGEQGGADYLKTAYGLGYKFTDR